ncbi:hypothetical protein NDU88_001754 [Pleurodeles waltl]|uniref:Uncharacterized protein n=1 Tax=Pleurodeles waltl TaxID=8319 RepID=A0AAV7L1G7_PLEWA|nr:hypothetical protein NDU88_001754 [Pleurodeles waltl]
MSQSPPRDLVASGQPRVADLPSVWFLPVPGPVRRLREVARRNDSLETSARLQWVPITGITWPGPGAPCRTRGSLTRSSFLSGQAPVPGPGRACLSQTGEPPSQGSPSPGFPSASRARCHGVRVSEGQRGTPAASLHHLSGAPGHSPLQALQRRTRHSLRRRPHQRVGPDPRARRDAVSPVAILGDLSIRSRPAFTAWAVPTPVPEVSSRSGR